MPTNRKRVTRKARNLTECELAFLKDSPQELPGWAGYNLWNLRNGHTGLDGEREPADLWAEHREELLAEFTKRNPGRRPVAWWLFDAPRQPDHGTGAWFEGTLQESRKFLGGGGRPIWEKYPAVVPWYAYGLPCSWEGFDSANPPRFESQASYLQRLRLLTAAEERILKGRPESFEPETVTWFEN